MNSRKMMVGEKGPINLATFIRALDQTDQHSLACPISALSSSRFQNQHGTVHLLEELLLTLAPLLLVISNPDHRCACLPHSDIDVFLQS
jgi:hypothetical protein